MSDDLVNELLNLGPDDSGFREVGVAAAQALTEARAEIERLRAVIDRVARVDNSLAKQLRASIENNAALVGELSTLRARVLEVVGPLIALTEDFKVYGPAVVAARQLMEEVK